ncbi:hypothetical protein [Kineococcus rhizosphaerae]|uniref:Uncharacterized protein n=1 Tax=Kineococcus rhizosphaerae TaxID=559628 RepID=A0A2T0R6V7_9ACTN|nr:hypothetical protein [Kineococcus rhizosphaerae]PRY16883.1 hypothetical protein CLV37_103315 [Kineococcus rhizosphaerae]
MSSGLSREELADVLERAHVEIGKDAGIRLLHRASTLLAEIDAAGLVQVLPPHPEDPDHNPRARIDWPEVVAGVERGGRFTGPHGRRRDESVVRIALSLLGVLQIDLHTELNMLDRPTTALVLAAIGASTQSHYDSYERLLPDGRPSGWSGTVFRPPLFPWPETPPGPAPGQGTLSLWPAAEEETAALAAALANPYPEVGLPLDDHVLRVLRHLRPADVAGMRGAGLARMRWPDDPGVRATRHELPVADVEEWLGAPLPEFDDLVPAVLRCFTLEPGPLPRRGTTLPDGEPLQVHVDLLWVAPDVDLDHLVLHHAPQDGYVQGYLSWTPWRQRDEPEDRTTDFTSAAGGHTGVSVGGTRIGVQRFEGGVTRIGWGRRVGGDLFGIALHVPREPREALEFLLRGRNVP